METDTKWQTTWTVYIDSPRRGRELTHKRITRWDGYGNIYKDVPNDQLDKWLGTKRPLNS